jgi:hypothetical protein
LLAHGREPPELPRFRVLSRIGAGASATVYRAHEASLDRIVALKVLHESSPHALRALKAEFDTLASLSHENVVKMYEVGEERELAYVVMELVEGVDFVRYVRSQPGLCHEDRLRDALVQCVVGIDQLHALGKVHRDIKPSNVRVTGEGRVVILDFGLLVDAHAGVPYEVNEGLQAGTAAYMAPEQAVGDPVSPATDFYALGTMLYQALTGDLPFHGSAHDMRVAKVSSPAPDPRARGLTLSEDLARLCVDLLAMQPAERPDAREVLTRLGRADKIRERGRRLSLPPAHRMPFVGRASELMRLELLMMRPKTDTECLHLVGGRGVGKTSLMREAARRAAQRFNVLWLESAASPGQRGPYEGFMGVIEGLTSHLVQRGVPERMIVEGTDTLHELFPALRRVGSLPHRLGPPLVPDRLERRWRALNALKHILCCLAEERTVVIWIDDWDLADLDTVRVAERLFRGRGSPPLLVVLASAPGDVALPLSERQVMVLGPLTPKENADLGQALTRGQLESAEELAQVVAASQGHPLQLIELLRLTSETKGASKALPDSLEEVVLARISKLSPEARRLLELLALVETPLHGELVQVALGRSPAELARAAEELSRAALVVSEEAQHGALAVTHGAIAQAVRAATAPEETIELHQRIADALSGAELSLLPLLTRHAMAGDRPELAADAAFRVSRAAAEVLAMDRAATFHSLSAELTQQKDQLVQYQSARALAESLAEAGRSVEAAYAYQLAYQTENAANALDLHRRSAELFVHSGHMEEAGLSCLRDALSTVGETLPETGRGALLSLLRQRAFLYVFGLSFEERTVQQVSARDLTRIDVLWSVGATLGLVDHVRGADFQARGLRYALKAGERSRVARALALEAAFSGSTERPPGKRARQLLSRAESMFGPRRDPYFEGLCSLSNAILDWSLSSHASYVAHGLAAEHKLRAHCTNVLWEVTSAQQLIVAGLPWLHRFRELDERAQRYQQEALERGSEHVHASIELLGGYMRFLASDDVKKARTRLKDAASLFSRERFLLQHLGEMLALLCVDQYEQRPLDEARIRQAREAADESHLSRTNVARYLLLHAEARLGVELGTHRPREAHRYGDELAAVAKAMHKLGTPLSRAESELWHAHALALRGQLDELPARFERVESALAELAPALALSVRYRRGRLIKGEHGKALIAEVTRTFKAEGVRNVPRMINAFAPAPAGADRG